MKDRPASETLDPTCDDPATCKFVGKARARNLQAGHLDVDALLEALETRNASRRAPEATVSRARDEGATLAKLLEFRPRQD